MFQVEEVTSAPSSLSSLLSSLGQYDHLLPNLPPAVDMLKVISPLPPGQTDGAGRVWVCVPYKAGSETWRYLLGGEGPVERSLLQVPPCGGIPLQGFIPTYY